MCRLHGFCFKHYKFVTASKLEQPSHLKTWGNTSQLYPDECLNSWWAQWHKSQRHSLLHLCLMLTQWLIFSVWSMYKLITAVYCYNVLTRYGWNAGPLIFLSLENKVKFKKMQTNQIFFSKSHLLQLYYTHINTVSLHNLNILCWLVRRSISSLCYYAPFVKLHVEVFVDIPKNHTYI